ncbi:ATP-binding protein [Azospirillum soli]|uniref:ATP-binding protein n=1 Tax=Azospirillum soli TaxID=1304799 RepID=UPI001AEA0BB2|nr:adenylate/guanylate cyclase domain-containing protein [Azospirillum soli]MBP2313063.1 class 3 adenylate cyclase/tetratricopeptide (TPR) repeat protein [Azospirillum soli]
MADTHLGSQELPEPLPGEAANGSALSRPDSVRPDQSREAAIRRTPAERKVVTVLFADIVESSAMVSGRDPEEADQALLAILQILTDGVGRYGGTIAQMLGDGMMAVFGAPSALEDHALRACLAAQDIARAAIESGEFKVRVGISSGEVVAQIVESGVWSDYRTVGETVHIAAKLQQRAEPNTVLLSRETRDLVPAGLEVRPAGVLRLAASAEPVPAYALESARAMRRTAMDLLSSDASLFVGRRRELDELTGALRRAEEGAGSLILLTGEAGIGKSRLTGELTRGSAASGFGVVQWPQFPIRRLGEPDDLEAVARSLALLVAGSATGEGPALVAAAAERGAGELAGEAVRELFGTPSFHPLWQGLDQAQKVDFSIEGLVAAILDLSYERPLLVLVEDAHWTRGLTNRLLDSLAGAVEEARVLVLVTARLDTPGGWTAPDHVRRVALEPLESMQIDEFLDHWLGHHPSLAELKARVGAQSQGVPLYLEESLRALESAGAIVGSPGQYEQGNADAKVVLPATVHGLLAARIDSLEPLTRRTLLHAAVIGTSVDLDLLRHIAPVPSTDLPALLERLERDGFFARSRLLPNMEVAFRHALVQEVAYATLTKRERQPLHGRVLRALRKRHDRDLPARIELMAHHAFFAEDWPAACAYGRRAGQRAEGRCRHGDAGRFYTNALKALEHLPETRRNALRRIDLWIAVPRILLPQGRQGADTLLDKARELALSIGDGTRYAHASSMLASFQWVYGDLDKGIALSRDALARLDKGSSAQARIQVLMRMGGMLTDKGLYVEAYEVLKEVSALATAADLHGRFGLTGVAAAAAAAYKARCLVEFGDQDEAVRHAQTAVGIAEEVGHAFTNAVANLYLGLTHLGIGQFKMAIPPLKTALTITEATRLHIYQPLTLGALGFALVRSGSRAEGTALLNASLEHSRMLNQSVPKPQILNWISETAMDTAQYEVAIQAAEEALSTARRTGQRADEARALLTLARTFLVMSRTADALPLLDEAERLGRDLSMAVLLARSTESRRKMEAAPQA